MEPRIRSTSGLRRPRRRAHGRRIPAGVRPFAAGAARPRPIRHGAPTPLPAPAPSRQLGWLALSALLHAGALVGALSWVERHDSVSIEPIPITWVRVAAGEGSGDAGSAAAPANPPAVVQPAPPDRPAKQPPARERRPARPAPAAPPSPAAATARDEIAAAAEQAPGPGQAGAEGESPAAGAVAASSESGERGAGAGSGVGAASSRGSGVGDGAGAGAVAGWMPRGGEQPRPSYPDAARRRGVEGIAHVALRLALTGRVDAVRLHRSAGDAQLDDAALAAVKRWRFDAPPPGADWSGLWFVVPIEFRLR